MDTKNKIVTATDIKNYEKVMDKESEDFLSKVSDSFLEIASNITDDIMDEIKENPKNNYKSDEILKMKEDLYQSVLASIGKIKMTITPCDWNSKTDERE